MTENISLRKCSRCRSTQLEKYFSTNRKGVLYKLCDNCRGSKKKCLAQQKANDENITQTYDVLGSLMEIVCKYIEEVRNYITI